VNHRSTKEGVEGRGNKLAEDDNGIWEEEKYKALRCECESKERN
jgi:hypothetical protein